MPQTNKQDGHDRPTIQYRWNPAEGASYELTGVIHEDCTPTFTKNYKLDKKVSQPKSPEILSTGELVTVVGEILSHRSFSVFQHKENSGYKVRDCQKGYNLDALQWETHANSPSLVKNKCINLVSSGNFSLILQPNLDFLRIVYGNLLVKSDHEIFSQSLVRRFLGRVTNVPIGSWEDKGLSSLGISYRLQSIYGWMSDLIPAGAHDLDKIAMAENQKVGCIPRPTYNPVAVCKSVEYDSKACLDSEGADICPVKCNVLPLVDKVNSLTKITENASLCSDYFLELEGPEANIGASETSSLSLCSDYCLEPVTSGSRDNGVQCWIPDSDELFKNKEQKCVSHVTEDERKTMGFPARVKPENGLAKQEHAFAGAFAGIFVSLCLHPVDTVKTVVQACHAEEKSLFYISKSIVSERGVSGLYRGISSKIASSAPVSAVYTFTYESIKGALLPLFPREYCFVAHCLAGGCASIATSFIFTPSERIKQQMQVGSQYRSCWHALVGITKKGGLPSLYVGWSAVLCRNIPHSVIKFYTYESLKQWMIKSQSSAQPATLQTLVCGGLAGSTAALFTTPFDVVKTRLQTQMPGTVSQYCGVFHALQEIGKHEGLRGLYRGLTPRLVMYISQGALFFASYEFMKRLFDLEALPPNGPPVQDRENAAKDSSNSLDQTRHLPASTSAASS